MKAMFSLKLWLEGAALNYECEKTCDLGWQILGLVEIACDGNPEPAPASIDPKAKISVLLQADISHSNLLHRS
jgi:hypothetical protein